MLRKKALLVCLAAVVLCVAGVALAKAVKVELLPCPAAAPLEPDASGKAMLNYAKGADKTEIQVNCSGLTPGEEYTVYIGSPWEVIGTFVARNNGTGNLHARPGGDQSGRLPVAVNNSANQTVLLSP